MAVTGYHSHQGTVDSIRLYECTWLILSAPPLNALPPHHFSHFPPPRRYPLMRVQFLTQTGDPYKPLQDAIEDDPSCVLAHCMRGLMISLTHTDPTAVFHSLAMAEKEFATACRVEGVTIDFRRSSMIAGGSRRGSVVDLRREWAYLAALRAFSAGRWRQVCVRASRLSVAFVSFVCVFLVCLFRVCA